MEYRPTVRYDMRFKDYVESLFQSTNLDRNQLMRLALYVLGHTSEGMRILEAYQKDSKTPPPLPSWELFEEWEMWLGKKPNREAVEDVRTKLSTTSKPISPPIKVHNLSYNIINIKEVQEDGKQKVSVE